MEDDSGVNSGSDFQSSSPGSDSHDYNLHRNQFVGNLYPHNPLTPPNSEPLVSPKDQENITPCNSPKTEEAQDHLRRLELTLQNSGLFHPKPEQEESDNEEFEDNSWKVPKLNSHGKPKIYKCKQCDFHTDTKEKHWIHLGVHIPDEKRLVCPKCPFVTEYKHHLEYHLRWHAGSKPFQCDKCEYSCVNKSMLNSHMKSHSNVYRYSCSQCSYATKYCHSLKIHLRRYNHTPNVVLDESGKPCPDMIIDVYGTRRGPKVKTPSQTPVKQEESSPRPELPFGLNQFPFPPYPFFGVGLQNPQLLQQLLRERMLLSQEESRQAEEVKEPGVLDLSRTKLDEPRNRRKGPAFKIDPTQPMSEDDDDSSTTMFGNVEVVETPPEAESTPAPSPDTNNNKDENSCQYCNISFGDPVLHTIHMGYHGFNNPFTCNMCGVECADKIAFFLHIARVSH